MFNDKRHTTPLLAMTLIGLVAALTSCKQNTSAPAPEKPAAQQSPVLPAGPAAMPDTSTPPNQAAGVAWTVPSGWEVGAQRPMRIATYRIHAIAGDPEDAECAVYYFGPGQGGTVEANLDRWAHEFTSPNGQTPTAKMEKRTIAGLKVSTISVAGTYLGAGNMMGQQEPSKPNFQMLGAIVEAPQGLVFFKLTGPLNTVASGEHDFDSLLASIHRQ
jgi:hypothetical protein